MLALAAALRVHHLGAASYWTDELISLKVSAGYKSKGPLFPRDVAIPTPPVMSRLEHARPVLSVVTAVSDDSHPPLYFVLLRLWREAFGDREAAVRSLSVAFSLLAVALLFVTACALNGPWTAVGASLLMAVAVPHIRYAQDARAYAMLTVIALGLCAAVIAVERRGASRALCAAVGVGTAAALFTHFHSAGVLAGIGAHALLFLRGRARRALLASMAVGAACWAVAWSPVVWKQFSGFRQTMGWQRLARAASPEGELLALARAPVRLLTDWDWKNADTGALAWLVLAVLACGTWDRRMRLWACLAGGSVVFVLAIDVVLGVEQIRIGRYLLAGSPGVYVALANVGKVIGRRAGAAVTAGLCLLALSGLPRSYRPNVPPWREYGALVGELLVEPLPVVFGVTRSDRPVFMAVSHYAFPRRVSPVFLSAPSVAGAQPPPLALPALLLADRDSLPDALHVLRALHRVGEAQLVPVVDWPAMPLIWRVEPAAGGATGYSRAPGTPP
ncbi:MAG TPA: glycosyltransferase family 39 protein [Vicinamibacteria bacterium]